MNERIRRLKATLDDIHENYFDGIFAEDEFIARSLWEMDRVLRILCEDGRAQEVDYVVAMLEKFCADFSVAAE